MYLPEFTRAALKNVRLLVSEPQVAEFDARAAVTAVLNPPDGPSRLIGLPYTDAMTEEALDAAVKLSSNNPDEPAVSFWLLVAFACTHAEQLPLQAEDVEATVAFLDHLL
ncbi:MAG: hypothetical protein K2W95_35240 [Candidatus Obscuribacterales bacterium]|nr:hypothetical protein [Candidatus Obscuribacterales bacterium]